MGPRRHLGVACRVFPNSLVAGSGGFTEREFFEITDATEREPVDVKF